MGRTVNPYANWHQCLMNEANESFTRLIGKPLRAPYITAVANMLSQFRSSIPLWYWKDLQGHISSSHCVPYVESISGCIYITTQDFRFMIRRCPITVSPTLTGVRHTRNDSQPIQTMNGADMGTDQFPECRNMHAMLPYQNQNLQKMEAEAKHKPLYMFGAALNSQCIAREPKSESADICKQFLC